MWWLYALLSALFASLTAIFAKVGIANVYEAAAFAKEMISGKFFLLKYPVQKYICSVKQYFRYFILKYFPKKRNAL